MNVFTLTTSRSAVIVSLAALFLGGCGSEGPPRFAVSGQVVYDGKPVTNGNIGFVPTQSSAAKSAGADIVDGRYEIPGYKGLLEGSYKVVIYAERPTGRKLQADEGSTERIDELVQYIPDVYNVSTTLSADVSGDREDLDFMLEKPKPGVRRRR